jgi:hypothetical protein
MSTTNRRPGACVAVIDAQAWEMRISRGPSLGIADTAAEPTTALRAQRIIREAGVATTGAASDAAALGASFGEVTPAKQLPWR